jgi:hypothetical protein
VHIAIEAVDNAARVGAALALMMAASALILSLVQWSDKKRTDKENA